MILESLERQLLSAHTAGDRAELMRLYQEAADHFEQRRELDVACFYLTQAYVFGLEAGRPETLEMQNRLWKMNREVRPDSEAEMAKPRQG